MSAYRCASYFELALKRNSTHVHHDDDAVAGEVEVALKPISPRLQRGLE